MQHREITLPAWIWDHSIAIAPGLLGLVERQVSSFNQFRYIGEAVGESHRNAKAEGQASAGRMGSMFNIECRNRRLDMLHNNDGPI
jgi:hypothetical protein